MSFVCWNNCKKTSYLWLVNIEMSVYKKYLKFTIFYDEIAIPIQTSI